MRDMLAAGPGERRTQHNVAHSLVLLASLGVLTGLSAYILTGLVGLIIVALLVVGIALGAPRMPAGTLMRLYHARLVPPDDSQLSSLVDVLAYRAGLSQRPDLYLIPSLTILAFAAGPAERPAIAISEGLVRRLSLREIAGVIAHEVAHIRNGDLWVMGLADLTARVMQGLSLLALALAAINLTIQLRGGETMSWLAIALLYATPALLNLLQLALSRMREFEADRDAAALTGDAVGLAGALRRIDTYTGHFWEDLLPPVAVRRVPQPSLLRTHPPADARIARVLDAARAPATDPLVIIERPMLSLVGMGPASMRPRLRWPGLWY